MAQCGDAALCQDKWETSTAIIDCTESCQRYLSSSIVFFLKIITRHHHCCIIPKELTGTVNQMDTAVLCFIQIVLQSCNNKKGSCGTHFSHQTHCTSFKPQLNQSAHFSPVIHQLISLVRSLMFLESRPHVVTAVAFLQTSLNLRGAVGQRQWTVHRMSQSWKLATEEALLPHPPHS